MNKKSNKWFTGRSSRHKISGKRFSAENWGFALQLRLLPCNWVSSFFTSVKSIDFEQQNLQLIIAQKSKILRHLNIEQGVSNISNATISDLPVNLLLFVAVFQNKDSFGGELYMQRIFWTISLAWEIWCYDFTLLFRSLAFRKHEKVCNILNITLVLDFVHEKPNRFQKKKISTKNKIDRTSCALVRFWNHKYDFRPNCPPLSSITIRNPSIRSNHF